MIGLFLIISSFSASATSSIAQPVTFSWEANEGVTASISIECEDKKISFWNSQSWKFFKCGEKIDSMPIVHHIDLRPQDVDFRTRVLFILRIQKDYKNLPEERALVVDFYPYGFDPSLMGLFTRDLFYGLENNPEVRELQSVLKSLKLFKGKITGNYYNLTVKAVKAFQKKYKLKQTGGVNKETRVKLNKLAK